MQTRNTPLQPTTINLTDPALQRWIRFPVGTQPEAHSGLRRTALQNLVKRSQGQIKAVHLREDGCTRGNKLIWLPSLLAYLHGLAEEQSKLTPEELAALPPEGGDQ